jgi:hypothetical protein
MANLPPRFKTHTHSPDPVLTVSGPEQPNAVTFFSAGVETLRISDKGFYVCGIKVKQDDKEAAIVYNSFKEWLAWQQLTR